jgi:hypothetical protein
MTPVVLFVGSRTAEQRYAVVAAGGWPVLIATVEDAISRKRRRALPVISLIAVFADLPPEQIARLRRSIRCPVLRLPLERLLPHAIAWAL